MPEGSYWLPALQPSVKLTLLRLQGQMYATRLWAFNDISCQRADRLTTLLRAPAASPRINNHFHKGLVGTLYLRSNRYIFQSHQNTYLSVEKQMWAYTYTRDTNTHTHTSTFLTHLLYRTYYPFLDFLPGRQYRRAENWKQSYPEQRECSLLGI